MAKEAQVTVNLFIRKLDATSTFSVLEFQSRPGAYTADVAGSKGPFPGAFQVSTLGTDVDLSQLTSAGGLCFIMNQDATNFVTVGVHDPDINLFKPVLELLPGEFAVVRLSRFLGHEFGTGSGAANTTFRIRADTSPCNVFVGAFDK